ncbi:amidase domain-containing protein [Peptostreptococcus stomatis]
MKNNLKAKIMLVSLIGILFFASTCIINGQESADEITLNNKTKIIDSIDNTLEGYFNGKFKYQNNINNLNDSLKYIQQDTVVYKESAITDDNIRNLSNINGEKIYDYKVSNDIKKIENTNKGYKVNVTYRVEFYYVGARDKSYIEEDHIIYLNNTSNKMLIDADIYDEDSDLEDLDNKYVNDKEEYEKEQIRKIEDISYKYKSELKNIYNKKEQNNYITSSRGMYNRNGARRWALDNALTLKNDYSADCTNFVSKAMCYGGGLRKDEIWYYHSNAWIRVIELRNWLLNRGHAQEKDHYKYADIGDIVQYYSKNKGRWAHSVIVTSRTNKYPYIRVSAHTTNRRDVNVSGIYYPRGDYSNYRVLHITR